LPWIEQRFDRTIKEFVKGTYDGSMFRHAITFETSEEFEQWVRVYKQWCQKFPSTFNGKIRILKLGGIKY
jgi:hypothetical protein